MLFRSYVGNEHVLIGNQSRNTANQLVVLVTYIYHQLKNMSNPYLDLFMLKPTNDCRPLEFNEENRSIYELI